MDEALQHTQDVPKPSRHDSLVLRRHLARYPWGSVFPGGCGILVTCVDQTVARSLHLGWGIVIKSMRLIVGILHAHTPRWYGPACVPAVHTGVEVLYNNKVCVGTRVVLFSGTSRTGVEASH